MNIDKGGGTKRGGRALRRSIEAEEAETPSWSSKTRKEAEIPSWSSIVKPLLPKVLCVNESKTQKHRSSVVLTHGGRKE